MYDLKQSGLSTCVDKCRLNQHHTGWVSMQTIALLKFLYIKTDYLLLYSPVSLKHQQIPKSCHTIPKINSSMCQTITIHHLCGHVFKASRVVCPVEMQNSVLRATALSVRTRATLGPCTTDSASETKVHPILCNFCQKNGIINAWVGESSALRINLMRQWKSQDTPSPEYQYIR